MSDEKICPIMSANGKGELMRCRESDCMFWIKVVEDTGSAVPPDYEDGGLTISGCVKALAPFIDNGRLKE